MLWTHLWLLACGGNTSPSTVDTDVDCETLPGTCGQAALNDTTTGDTGCPEGYTCWGPSAFVCYRGTECDLPICLAPNTVITTPTGPTRLDALSVGDLVFTQDREGLRVVAPIEQVGSTIAPHSHEWVQILLADGRAVAGSPGHPTTDGLTFGELVVGDLVDGSRVAHVWREPYPFDRTYDLLPAGSTGAYLANGVWVGSTLGTPR